MPVGSVVAGLGTVKAAMAPLVTVEQNGRRRTCPPPPTLKLTGLSPWSVARKHTCPEASFCWLRSVMLAPETVAQFWAKSGAVRKQATEMSCNSFFIFPHWRRVYGRFWFVSGHDFSRAVRQHTTFGFSRC